MEYRESLKPLLAALSERERQIIMMRFFQNMTQAQIAKEVGVSQMHVTPVDQSAVGTPIRPDRGRLLNGNQQHSVRSANQLARFTECCCKRLNWVRDPAL